MLILLLLVLITLLAYCGSFVPAESALIGPIDKILTRIGASDDLVRGLSTFMVEMTETASILRQATENSLVLMDEIGRGTSTYDGLSLAVSIADELATERKCLTLFATHYFEITQLETVIPQVANVHVAATNTQKDIVFLHEIQPGPANQSYGIAVARLAGVPQPVIRKARKILKDLENKALQNGTQQLDLFAYKETKEVPQEVQKDVIRERILELNLDDMTPRQAWELLYNLQKEVSQLD